MPVAGSLEARQEIKVHIIKPSSGMKYEGRGRSDDQLKTFGLMATRNSVMARKISAGVIPRGQEHTARDRLMRAADLIQSLEDEASIGTVVEDGLVLVRSVFMALSVRRFQRNP
jgi:hypothetical protein